MNFCIYEPRRYHELPIMLRRGRGAYVYDTDGRRFMDLLSVCSALGQGHAHPRIVAAARAQLGRLTLTSRSFHHDRLDPLLRRLCRLTKMQRAMLMSTGGEAVEMAIKAMRQWGYRVKAIARNKAVVLVARGNFHGRTTTIAGFSDDPATRENFGPPTPGFKSIPYGDGASLEAAITDSTCGFLVEPIQGEAGVRLPPAGYLREIRKICSRRKVLLCFDEIQTGLGRTGRMFCADHESVHPDMFIIGKSLSGGVYPVSAVVASAEILDLFVPGSHCSTYGGSPVACAAAMAALDVIIKQRLPGRAEKLGGYFLRRLKTLRHPRLREVRGRGLLLAMEFARPLARRFCDIFLRHGFLTKVSHERIVRLSPPLIITRRQIDQAFSAIAATLKELEND